MENPCHGKANNTLSKSTGLLSFIECLDCGNILIAISDVTLTYHQYTDQLNVIIVDTRFQYQKSVMHVVYRISQARAWELNK